MTDIQRWLRGIAPAMYESDEGDYVLYADHVEALRQAEQRQREDDNRALWDQRQYEQGQRDALAANGQRESDAYKKGWEDATRFAAEQAKPLLRRDAMDTSRKAVQRNADQIKGTQAQVYGLLKNSRNGLTDFELESITGIVHQSISAARRALVVAGLVTDSGERRANLRGNDAAVWVLSSPESKEPDVHDSPVGPLGSLHNCNPTDRGTTFVCPGCLADNGQEGLWP